MKKHIALVFIILVFTIITGCQNSPGTISDYFPAPSDTIYHYTGRGAAGVSFSTFNTYTTNTKIQRRVVSEAFAATEVLDRSDKALKLIFAEPQFYYYENLTDVSPIMEYTILQEPLQIGAKWSRDENTVCEITSTNAAIQTDELTQNEYKALEVSITKADGGIEKEYYAKGIGLIKSVYPLENGQEVTVTLSEIIKDTSIEIPFDVFLANVATGQLDSEPTTFNLKTNMDIQNYFETELSKVPTDDYESLLTAKTKINTLQVDRTESLLQLDLSQHFINDRTMGAGIESMVLQGLADTLGRFYDVEQVGLTIDGKRYETGHIIREIDEYFTVTKESNE